MRLNRDLKRILDRKTREVATNTEIIQLTQAILTNIRLNGDAAVRSYAKKFDGFDGESLIVSKEEIERGVCNAGKDFMRILQRTCSQIRDFHENQKAKSWQIIKNNGVIMGQILRPFQRVALYVPGGTAAYPSTVLMNAIPALIAGVEDLTIFTPVKENGQVSDAILAAASCCGIEKIYKIGGAHAIAAAAYGTESIAKFDKIAGPGNIFVATAKRLVYGEVDIDMIAGPSEILIIADESAEPKHIAADLMSQAEHDELASTILITTSEKIIEETEQEIEKQINCLKRQDIIRRSLENYGIAISVKNLNQAFAIANDIAPEHLEILTENPIEKLPMVKNAGSIFLGANTPEPLGDYMSGTNHVLPTNGTAKFYSPLGVYDFIKWSSYSFYPKNALINFKDDVIKFAEIEGLDAHANAIRVRFE